MIYYILSVLAFGVISWMIMRGGVIATDHFEMLSIAADDYQKDPENFDISHYPNVTLSEIQTYIKKQTERKRNDLQRKCNDNPDFIFDE